MTLERHTMTHYNPPMDVFAWVCTRSELITGQRILKADTIILVANATTSGKF
jgi:hypothetical protein